LRSPFSIANGSAFGLVSYAEIKLLAGRARRVVRSSFWQRFY
jgi:xanthine/uracil/vitamin C permease (AzgA family)